MRAQAALMNFIQPAPSALATIAADATWPSVMLQTDAPGTHQWNWQVSWGPFVASGTASTPDNAWNATSLLTNRGGIVKVTAVAGGESATATVTLKGTNPTQAMVAQYLSTKPDADGFDKILLQESRFRHFAVSGDPVKSFDNGYGMCQLTNPTPTFEQVWNWKSNITGGLALYAQKRAMARTYLSQSGRKFTDVQLRFETVCRWNGGSYHRWDTASNQWVRSPTIVCDSLTGNIGWDMTDAANAGQTQAQLHARDNADYSKPPGPSAHWRFFGVCYADHVLR
jgi:hypothetical protein